MVVHDHGAMFDVFARIHEVDAEHVEITLLAAEVLIHADADHVAAERHHGMTQRGALPHVNALIADLLGTLVPLLNERGGDVRIPAGGDFHAFGDAGVAVMFHDHIGMRMVRGDDDQMEGVHIKAIAVHFDQYRLFDLTFELQHRRLLAGIPLHGGDAVIRLGDDAGTGIAQCDPLEGHAIGQWRSVNHADGDFGIAGRPERIEEFLDTFNRRITPILLGAIGLGEGLHVEGARRAVGRRRHGRRIRIRIVRIRDGNVDFLSLCHGDQPTDPSICSSTSRFSSSAYSIGSSRLIGSTKPRTIMPMASSSERPRLIR